MTELEMLRQEVENLKFLHALDRAEIMKLRRWIEALEEDDD